MENDPLKTLCQIGLKEETVTKLLPKKKFVKRLLSVVEQAQLPSSDPTKAMFLYTVAEKLPESQENNLKLLLDYVKAGKIANSAQLDKCISFLKGDKTDSTSTEDFEKECGIGVTYSDAQIEAVTQKIVDSYRRQIEVERYLFKLLNLSPEVKKEFIYVDSTKVKECLQSCFTAIVGEMNQNDKEIQEMKDFIDKTKKNKKASKEEKDKATEFKAKLKEIEKNHQKILGEAKTEENKGKYALFSQKGRDTKLALNTKENLEAHNSFTKGKVFTRFPPEPNGYLHIGHARAMRFSFDSARENEGHCYLRFDDTNPAGEGQEYIDSIIQTVEWLGYSPFKITYSSDYFDQLYKFALQLINEGKAFICELTREQMSAGKEKKENSPFRERPVEENLKLFEAMRAGEVEEGKLVLRLKIDMTNDNPNLRDPVAYRVIKTAHPRTGNAWCIYPSYDFTHCLCDSLENITHSLCTLEFEIRRDLYYWVLDALNLYKPSVFEYSRLNLTRALTSKRKIKKLVESGVIEGWDDPRLFTLAGLKNRGVPAETINSFIDSCGIARRGNENFISHKKFENQLKNDLDKASPRFMSVLRPLEVELVELPEDFSQTLEIPLFPKDLTKGTRKVLLNKRIFIEQTDFREEAEEEFKGLTLNQEVGLKGSGVLKVKQVVKDGEAVVRLLCSFEDTERKTKGRIHWISKDDSEEADFVLYDYLFDCDKPGEEKELEVNKESKQTVKGLVHKDISSVTEPSIQFERLGFFKKSDSLTFSRIIEQ